MNKMRLLAIGAGAILAATGVSNAAPLPPGSGIAAAPEPFVGAGLPLASITSTLSNGVVGASITSQVYGNDPANPFGPGFLTFVYTVQNTGADVLERVNFDSFAGVGTDAGFGIVTPPPAEPSTVTRSSLVQDGGALVGFNFDDPFGQPTLQPGATTYLIVQTNSPSFDYGIANIIDGSIASGQVLTPVAAPEPASLGLLGIGGLLMLRKRR